MLNFLMVMATIFPVWWLVFFGRPLLAKAKFEYDLGKLRDDLADWELSNTSKFTSDHQYLHTHIDNALNAPHEFLMFHEKNFKFLHEYFGDKESKHYETLYFETGNALRIIKKYIHQGSILWFLPDAWGRKILFVQPVE